MFGLGRSDGTYGDGVNKGEARNALAFNRGLEFPRAERICVSALCNAAYGRFTKPLRRLKNSQKGTNFTTIPHEDKNSSGQRNT